MSYHDAIRLLIVEDDEDDYFLLEHSLKMVSFETEITWASSFERSQKILQSLPFDLVFIDYRLGVNTGLDVIDYVNTNFPYTPTILLTGLKESAINHQALKSGAYEYISKSQYTVDSLDQSIRYAIEKAKTLRSLKESEIKYRNLFENAVEYIFLTDAECKVIDANKTALRLFEYSDKESIEGLDLSKYIEPPIFGLNVDQKLNSREIKILIPELNKRSYCILNTTVLEAQTKQYQWVFHDITERKVNEQKVSIIEKQALTGKVARVIGHEIKNPLGNIHLALHELKRWVSDESNDINEADDLINIIERSGKRINNLLEDLLSATKFDTINLSDMYIHDVLQETMDLIRDRIRLTNISMEHHLDENCLIKADKEKIMIALLNLLVNAVEAMPEKDGKIEVRTACYKDTVDIIIKDNGSGIPPENIAKLFDPFFTSKKGGNGLGLTSAYNIITKHDGMVKVLSKPGEGTTFTISLPIHET